MPSVEVNTLPARPDITLFGQPSSQITSLEFPDQLLQINAETQQFLSRNTYSSSASGDVTVDYIDGRSPATGTADPIAPGLNPPPDGNLPSNPPSFDNNPYTPPTGDTPNQLVTLDDQNLTGGLDNFESSGVIPSGEVYSGAPGTGVDVPFNYDKPINLTAVEGEIGLGESLGYGAIIYDGYQSFYAASQQAAQGNYLAAALTIEDWGGRTALILQGATVGAAFGGPLGAVAGGLAGALISAGAGASTPQQALENIVNAFNAMVAGLAKDIGALAGVAAHPILTAEYIQSLFDGSQTKPDPLVIDLTGKGLNLISLSNSTTEFDYNGSGLEENTAWVGSGTGILVLPNAQGQVTNGTELFGPTTGVGFTELAALDSNHDGVINSSDADWSQLRIWQDTNGNGVVDTGELETLAQGGITSISLSYASTNTTLNGNDVVGVSTVTFANGTTSTADEVDFAADLLNTTPNPNETTASSIPAAVEALPWLKGYGQLYNLDVAMSGDATLQQDVTALTQVAAGNISGFDADTTAILYEWAGVTNVNPNSRGGYFDARSLETLEHYTGINWIHVGQGNVGSYHPYVTAAWDELFGNEELNVAVQTSFSQYLPGLYYNPADDAVEGLLNVQATFAAIPSGAPSGESGELFGLDGWFNFLVLAKTTPQLLTDLDGNATELPASAVGGLFGGYWIGNSSLSNFLQTDGSEFLVYGDGWSGTIAAQNGVETIDTGNGNVTVSSPDGDKAIYTGTGNDTVNLAGTGNTVTTGTGTTYVTAPSGNNTITSGSALTTYVRAYGGVLALESLSLDADGSLLYANAGYSGTLTLYNDMQFAPTSYSAYDNLVFMPSTQASFSIAALPSGDAATIFVDEAGNDTLTFANGQTTIWVANDGTDTATLSSGTTDIQFAGPSTDYTVSYDGHGVLTVTNIDDLDANGTKTLTLAGGNGELWFADGVKIGFGNSVSTVSPDAAQYGGSGNDAFYVDGGASTINGGAGTNTVYFDMNSVAPDGHLVIGETASGAVTINGAADGYNGTATLTNIQTVYFGNNYYTLFATPSGGGSVTNASSSTYNLVEDGAGTDTLTFSTGETNYWHAGAGTTTATLSAGTTEIYFTGPASDYTVAYNGTSQVVVTDKGAEGTGTKTINLTGGAGELVFGDGTRIGLGNSQTSSTPDATQYGTSANDTFWVNGGIDTINGGAGTDVVDFNNSGSGVIDGRWQVSENASGQFVIGGVNAGYDGTATLANVEEVNIEGSVYNLFATPVGGGSLTVNYPNNGYGNALVADGAGTDTISFTNPYTSDWHAGAGTTTATLTNGTTEVYFGGPASDYTVAYNGTSTVTVTDTGTEGTGTKTIVLTGGNGELVFGDGTRIGLGNSLSSSTPDATQYGTSGNDTFWVDGGTSTINGGAGTDIVDFNNSGTGVLDGRWSVSENASGQFVIGGGTSGYDGTATLTNVEQVNIEGAVYNLFATSAGGGSLTVNGSSNALVTDGAGSDTISFTNTGTSYWHAGAGTTAATLSAGTTEIYFTGIASQYTVAYNSTSNVVTVTDSVAGRNGTKTITLSAGNGELVFADGTRIDLGNSQSSSSPDAVQDGTAANDTFWVNGGISTINGGSGTDLVDFNNAGTGVVDGRWSVAETASGQFVIGGVNAGYDGTATLANVEQVGIAGTTYALFAAPAAGGSLTVGGTGSDLVADSSGNDALTFSGTGTNYWHTSGGTDTATLSAGTTEIYFLGAESQYTIAYNGTTDVVTVTDSVASRNGTKTITLTGGAGELVFADGSRIGIGSSVSSSIPDATQYGSAANDTFYVDGGASTINGGAGTNTVRFDMNTVAPDGNLVVTDTAGVVSIGGIADGYNGTASLTNIQTVYFGSNYYTLFATPSGGGSVTNASSSTYNLVSDGAGTDTLTFSTSETNYWHAGAGTTTATLSAGTTEVYFTGPASDYTVAYNGTSTVTVTDKGTEGTGTKTIVLTGGNGELVFGDNTRIGLGSSQSVSLPDATQYGTSGNDTFWVNGGTDFVDGGAGSDLVNFGYSNVAPDQHWQIAENAAGQVVINGAGAGDNVVATLADIETIGMNSANFALFAAPAAGGTLAVNGGSNAIVADSTGNDTLTFTNTATSYWHAGGGNDTATLSAGTTEIYFTGIASQYTVTYNSTSDVVTVTDSVTGRNGTKTITLSAGNGELVFADGTRIDLGNSQSSSSPDAVQDGTAANDTFWVQRWHQHDQRRLGHRYGRLQQQRQRLCGWPLAGRGSRVGCGLDLRPGGRLRGHGDPDQCRAGEPRGRYLQPVRHACGRRQPDCEQSRQQLLCHRGRRGGYGHDLVCQRHDERMARGRRHHHGDADQRHDGGLLRGSGLGLHRGVQWHEPGRRDGQGHRGHGHQDSQPGGRSR